MARTADAKYWTATELYRKEQNGRNILSGNSLKGSNILQNIKKSMQQGKRNAGGMRNYWFFLLGLKMFW
jgi:hypothetical protein